MTSTSPSQFDAAFCEGLERLFRWRRDVRHFRRDAIPPETVAALVDQACLAPSVGFSQPWRFVSVEDAARRARVRDNFLKCNREALADFAGERAKLYATLKLAGLDEAPVHLAVFADNATGTGHGLGQKTMPETLAYSAVMAIHTFWLAARARGIGLGWVSILDPDAVKAALDVPQTWAFIAYLCVGLPERESDEPELLQRGWEQADETARRLLRR
ncbi:MAG TPA: 5,6-dimethylbenzimidazole synthase [Alphaproteobacteria bacterium]|nr:5,6-dimethylbenzimidazole synthase [Alphaproteobacteria bacterium]